MLTASPPAEARPARMAGALSTIRDDLENLTCDGGPVVLERLLADVVARLGSIIDRLESEPEHSWSRIGLMNPAGELLWSASPPGGWPALHPHEARSWADLGEFADWLGQQADDFRARLAADGWRTVHLDTAARVTFPAPE